MVLDGVPALVVSRGAPEVAAERGTVFLLHGLGVAKEVQQKEAESLAARGFLAVVLDAVGHGERRFPDWDERFSPERSERSYFEVVRQTADELPGVLKAAERLGWIHPGRVGACGISMGGAVLFGALSRHRLFDAAATLVATPRWLHAAESPHQHPERLFPTALLMQTGGADSVVPASDAREFHQALLPHYAGAPDRLRYVEHGGEGHMFAEATWNRAWGEVVEWFERFLVTPGG